MEKLKLNLEKPVAFYPQLAEVLGGAEEALYFQQLYYWSDKGEREDGFIYKSKKKIEEETTLSRYQQDRIRKKFKKKGILETKKKKVNGAPTLHYKVKPGKVRNLLMDTQETNDSNRKKLTNPTYTENTTENTTDLDFDKSTLTGKEINSLIGMFEQVNPSYDNLFNMDTQRNAIKQLVDKFGKREIVSLIDVLEEVNSQQYAPTITTPHQLLQKLGKLKAFIQRSKNNNNSKQVL